MPPQAMQIAFFHWGFHIWGIFGIVGLALAYFAFRHGLPPSLRSALYPLIGERIYGPIGHFVDVLVILGTLFGIATTLGLSVTQINAGLNYLGRTSGHHGAGDHHRHHHLHGHRLGGRRARQGVKNLSLLNIVLATVLMLFVLAVGPTIFILETFCRTPAAT